MLPEGLQFASRFDHVIGSAIREIFKVLTRPNMISFAGGSPSAEALPDRECAEIARQVLLDDGKRILQYGATEGYPPFVESLISYLKEHYGLTVNEKDYIITYEVFASNQMPDVQVLVRGEER